MRSRLTAHFFAIVLSFVASIYSDLTYGQTVTCIIPPEGGTCDLPGFVSVTFPRGAFIVRIPVTVSVTNFPETREVLDITVGNPRLPYEIRINSGNVAPVTSVDVMFNVPDQLTASVPPDQRLQVFAQIYDAGKEEILDHFHDFPSTFDPVTKKADANLPMHAFSNRRQLDLTYEAIVIMGAIPTLPTVGSKGKRESKFR